ncbi:MAG TPA: NADPH:quinone oxidoreductase family protein [Candidatus Dormibacteraeota bacterium]|nr:NADPH:quinone oxidoreductase family protein [Candidatus Dormibacteraeota bacterium]
MKAWVVHELGGPESLRFEDVDPGQRADGLVRIEVRAASINFPDALMVAGLYQAKPDLPFVPGFEVSGMVLEAQQESGFQPGDRVMALLDSAGLTHGGYGEIADASAAAVFNMPESMPFDEAAGFTLVFQTGWFGLHRRASLQPGETLLVHAGAGGVGSAAIQLGKAAGATVIATAGSDQKVALCKQLGADLALNYKTQDFVEEVNRATAGRGADVIFDPVGGDVYDRSTKCIAFEGRIVLVGFTSGRIPQAAANHVLVKNYSVVGLHWGLYRKRAPELIPVAQTALLDLYRQGKIKTHISTRLPLKQAPRAMAMVAEGKSTGKVVLLTKSS